MKGLARRKPPARITGPLCAAWDDPDLDKWWPDCYHRSCWAIANAELDAGTGLRPRVGAS